MKSLAVPNTGMKTQAAPKTGSRLAYLDNIRIYLTVLVILHHSSIAFGGGGDWLVKDPTVDAISPILLGFFTAVNQTYFMSAFFLLAGYFTPRSLEKKGPASFLIDRLIRLGIPLLVYTTLIININEYLVQVVWRKMPFTWLVEYDPGHLWFLQALLLFAVIYVVYRGFSDRDRSQQRFQVFSDRYPTNRALIFTIAVLAILTFVVRIFVPIGEWIGGFQLAHFVHYIFCFFIGILAYRGDWFSRLEKSQARPWGILALVMLPVFFAIAILGGVLEGEEQLVKFAGGVYWQSFVYSIWESVMLIAVMTFLLYFFRERITQAGPLARTLAASVYTVYIIHQTLVTAVDILFIPISIPTILKFVFVSIISVPLCFGLGILIRKIPYAQRVLG
jgi:surface polysaccharide O-acyltransferase-like enzyme